MQEIPCLTIREGFTGLEFTEREVTPELAMKLGIQLQLARLSLANTVQRWSLS